MATLDEKMPDKIQAARRRIESGSGGDVDPSEEEQAPYSPDELRTVFRKFRRLLGAKGNPGTVEIEGALRAGWIIASGPVEGYPGETFHVVMLTNGALHYTSGEVSQGPLELTGKWFLGDSIPSLEARIPDTMARILAEHGVDWQ